MGNSIDYRPAALLHSRPPTHGRSAAIRTTPEQDEKWTAHLRPGADTALSSLPELSVDAHGIDGADQRRVEPLVLLRSLRPRVESRAVRLAHLDIALLSESNPIGFCQHVVARQNDDHVQAAERTAGPRLRALQTPPRLRRELSLGRRRGRPMGSLQVLELWRTLRVSPPYPADAHGAGPYRLTRPGLCAVQ